MGAPDQLLDFKKKLISANADTFLLEIGSGQLEGFSTLFATLVEERAKEGGDKTKVLCCDVLSIWLLRYTQTFRKHPELKRLLEREDLTSLFHYIMDFLEQSSGAFANALSSLLTKLVDTVDVTFSSKKDQIFQSWIDSVMTLSITNRSKYQLVEILGKKTSTQYILDEYPTFGPNCISIMWSDALANAAGKSFATIYRGVYNKSDELLEWIQLWQATVLDGLRNLDLRKNVQTYLLPLLFTISNESFRDFMNITFKSSKSTRETDLDLLIAVAKVGQDLAIVTEPFDPLDQNAVIPLPRLVEIMIHQSPKYRLASFSLFLGSPKSSVPIPQYIFDTLVSNNIIETFFLDYDDTDIRNDFVSSMKQFLIRILESSYSAKRDLEKLQKKNFEVEKQQSLQRYLVNTRTFLQWLMNFLIVNLAPGSNYAQFYLGFHITEFLITLGVDESVELTSQNTSGVTKSKKSNLRIKLPYSIEIFSTPLIRILLDNVTNNYEDLREKSTSLLLMCPEPKIAEILIGNANQLTAIINTSLEILLDLKGRKSEGAARVFQFLTQAFQRLDCNDKVHELFDIFYKRIDSVLDRTNLLLTTSETVSPEVRLHGIFNALRLMLSSVNQQSFLVEKDYYSKLFSKFIGSYYPKLWKLVKPALATTTGDLSEVEEKLTLNYSWKLVKESTSLLKLMLEISSKNQTLISKEEFLTAVDITMDQLSSVNHRGAFSSVYPTFITCCQTCLELDEPYLQNKPSEWLKTNIILLELKTQLISRRSGGLPYLITGILTAIKNCKHSTTLKEDVSLISFAMNELIRIASIPYIPNADEKMDIPQVHAFNSMKHIFIDSQLSDYSVNFVKDALKLSLLNCNSTTWAIRNCAVMLFTALQNRLFGTKKLGGIVPTINAKSFFSTYDGVEEILLNNLNEALSGTSNVESVFPILTILVRLESNNDSIDSSLKKFEVLLINYLSHLSWKIREVASRALAAVIKPIEIGNFSLKLLEELNGSMLFNKRHGYLLTILEIIKRVNIKLPDVQVPVVFIELLTSRVSAFVRKSNTFNWAISKVYIDILSQIMDLDLPVSTIQYLSSFVLNNYLKLDSILEGQDQLFLQDAIKLLLSQHLKKSQIKECIELANICVLTKEGYEVQLIGIAFCKENFDFLYDNRNFESLWIQLSEDLWLQIITDEKSWSLVRASALSLSQKLLISLQDANSKSEEKLASRIALLMKFTESDHFSEDVNTMAFEVLGPLSAELVKLNKKSGEEAVDEFFSLASSYSDDNQPFNIRYSAYSAISAFAQSFDKETIRSDNKFMAKTVFFLYFGLWDDDREIRDLASSTLSKLFNFELERQALAISKHIRKNLEALNLANVEEVLISVLCNEKQSIATSIQAIQKQDENSNLLFDIESVNLYRNESQLHMELSSMLNQITLQPESIARVRDMLQNDFEAVKVFINSKGPDGYIGWTRNEFVFIALFKLISNLISFKTLNLIDLVDVQNFKTRLIQLDIHPLLKDKLSCI